MSLSRRCLVRLLLNFFLLSESLITCINIGPAELAALCCCLVVFDQVFVTYFEHFVDEADDLWIVVAGANEDVRQVKARLEKNWIILLLHRIQFLNDLKNLLEAMVHELIALFLEFVVPDEDLIIGLDVGNPIGQSVLSLTGQVSDARVQDSHLDSIADCRGAPFFLFQEIQNSLNNLEEFIFRVARDHHEEAQSRLEEFTHLIQTINVSNLYLLAQTSQPFVFIGEVLIHPRQDSLQQRVSFTNQAVQK